MKLGQKKRDDMTGVQDNNPIHVDSHALAIQKIDVDPVCVVLRGHTCQRKQRVPSLAKGKLGK
jgi:hypothetical protein